jgi:hypothetical protein
MLKRSAAFVLLALSGSPLAAEPQAGSHHDKTGDLRAAARLLQQWWPGQYDNHEQIVRQSGGGISPPTSAPFRRLHTDVKALVAPALGEHVVAISQYADNDPTVVIKREIAVFAIDPSVNALRVQRYTLGDWKRLDDPAATATLQPAALAPLGARCDVLLRFAGGQFEGSLASPTCPAAKGNAAYDVIVGPKYVGERGEGRARARVVWEMAPGSNYDWYQETRARPYTCNVFDSPGGEMAKAKFLKTIHLHDQGGEAEIAWPDGRTLVFTIHERAFTATPEREYPLFRIHEKGNPVPIAYAYAVDNNTRFGLNLGWFYIRCYDDADIGEADMIEAKK